MKKSQATDVDSSMMLIHSAFSQINSFSMMPVTPSCPFVEAIFDPVKKILVVITKDMKERFQMVARLDDNGDPLTTKTQNKVRQQRVKIQTYNEFYLIDEEDIRNFINKFACNPEFDYKEYMKLDTDIKVSNIIQ